MGYYSLAVFDYSGNKLCDLCDSTIAQNGRAYNIKTTTEQNGWKELSFDLPLKTDGVKNYRWDFIKSDYLIRLLDDDREDWFIIQKPKPARSATAITQSVTCPHISSTLKTKKLYQTFDEKNGIGTLPYLVDQVLVGTGWRRGRYETFYEADGVTIKVRSVESDGKEGAYSLITKICELFQAYPVFNGDKTIDFFNLKSHRQEWEFIAGINTNNVTVSYNSSDLITRMYVEGDYDQNSYVGIDDVNPTGLNFLVNFDYYRDIGLFTSEHQTALDTYISNVSSIKQQIETNTSDIMMYENVISRTVGDIPFMVGDLRSGTEQDVYINGATSESTFVKTLYVHSDSTHSETQQTGDKFKLCYVQKAKGQIGAKEVGIETKQIMIDSWQEKITSEQQKSEPSQEKITEYTNKITELNAQITTIQNELDPLVNSLCLYAIQLDKYLTRDTTLNNTQNDIEIAFANAMGDMLKDGLMENKNYAPGQETSLYADALDKIERMSHPVAEYTIGYVSAKDVFGVGIEDLSTNSVGHIIDDDITINTKGYIKKIVRDYDKEDGGSITLTTDDLSLSATTLSAVISRITDISNLFDRNESIYGRAGNFDSDGTLLTGRLKGKLDAAVTQLSAVTSNWYTDDRGNIIFESTSGDGAMMLCGEGWMVANGKNASGNWNWRTVGTGSGIVADEITTGFLSAERILAGTITAEKIESGYGAVIDLSGNAIVTTMQSYAEGAAEGAKNLAVEEAKRLAKEAVENDDGTTKFVTSTATYQDAASIITAAVKESTDAAGETYIAKTTTLQTAEEIIQEAVKESTDAAGETYIAKTTLLQTADEIVAKATRDAQTDAGNKYVRGTSSMMTADAIVTTAISETSESLKNSFIQRTDIYQTAESIVSSAKTYVDGELKSYSTIEQTSEAITAEVSSMPTIYKQADQPTGTETRPLLTGDIWVDIDNNNKIYTYNKTMSRWDVSSLTQAEIDSIINGNESVKKAAKFTLDGQGHICLESYAMGHIGTISRSGIYMTPGSIVAQVVSGSTTNNSIIINEMGIEITATGKFVINSDVLSVDENGASFNGMLLNNGNPVMTKKDFIFSSTEPVSTTSLPLQAGMIWLQPTGSAPVVPTVTSVTYAGSFPDARTSIRNGQSITLSVSSATASAPGGNYRYSFTGSVDCWDTSSSSDNRNVSITIGSLAAQTVSVYVRTGGSKDISFSTTSTTWLGDRGSISITVAGGAGYLCTTRGSACSLTISQA